MRLLHARSRELHEYDERSIPRYAILSHTWTDQEVLYKDIEDGLLTQKLDLSIPGANDPESNRLRHACDLRGRKSAGLAKITNTCNLALQEDISYVWIDTCCIDKSSSAELTEAINSMFKWYQDAEVCYAFIADLAPDREADQSQFSFDNCRWFTRGWTLQELLAPKAVRFYGSSWKEIGTRWSLCAAISQHTRIPEVYLKGKQLDQASVAQRMSWASSRITKRKEDIAYCLLGIFGVNMPLLYGEGEKAFRRLQEEIMRGSVDHSLFAWGRLLTTQAKTRIRKQTSAERLAWDSDVSIEVDRYGHLGMVKERSLDLVFGSTTHSTDQRILPVKLETVHDRVRPILPLPSVEIRKSVGVLATSPAQFAESGNIVPHGSASSSPYSLENKGLRMKLPICASRVYTSENDFVSFDVAILRCHIEGDILEDVCVPVFTNSKDQITRATGSFDILTQSLLAGGLRRNQVSDVYWTLTPQRPLPNMIHSKMHGEERPIYILRSVLENYNAKLVDIYPRDIKFEAPIIFRAALGWDQTKKLENFQVALMYRYRPSFVKGNASGSRFEESITSVRRASRDKYIVMVLRRAFWGGDLSYCTTHEQPPTLAAQYDEASDNFNKIAYQQNQHEYIKVVFYDEGLFERASSIDTN